MKLIFGRRMLLIVLLGLLVLVGCGKKGPPKPVPPETDRQLINWP